MYSILYVNIFELCQMLENQLLYANLYDSDTANQSNPSFYAKPIETISLEALIVYKGIIQIFDKHMSQS